MSTLQAWQYIIENWNTPKWNPIPLEIKQVLNLDSRLGMKSGILVSYNGSHGMDEFIQRVNNKNLDK